MRAFDLRIAALVFLLVFIPGFAAAVWPDNPPQPPSEQYGNILMNRLSGKHGQPWVSFSHWSHRTRYTCRVCHLELGFEMRVNATEITEEKNRNGEFCGACHNGKIAFAHAKGNCGKCHNGDISTGGEKFKNVVSLPAALFGNRIDWTEAVERGLIRPKQSLIDDSFKPVPFKSSLTFEIDSVSIPPAVFSHQKHTRWLDCANCHPDLFMIKQTTADRVSMKAMSEGKSCGICHVSVAFPLNDCMRCHPQSRP